MSTINKLEQALAGTKGLASQFKTFALDTDDQNAKQMFNQLSQTAEDMVQQLEGRVEYVKNEEPQYREEQ
ncbi:MAG: DUF1657 domain-containing protein [Tepidibacter sp.]|jgi:uncharacterized protein involved in exopolysaccharide biosynthesis|uniref:DUF1657 domain-containing protein n=1 Tax=Tepidibacter sp. TaxID=2529387 RepID=UPI0025F4D8D0|nr:DUF1657 domain-containing protein [Tepidibacter sp.]MCT4509609.1 DUF1657 domain-containing protein [Tepidibacter sp.]